MVVCEREEWGGSRTFVSMVVCEREEEWSGR